MRHIARGTTFVGLLSLLLFQWAAAQSEEHLRAAFEGTIVAPKVDMPASASGIDLFPAQPLVVDLPKVRASLASNGIAIKAGARATVTRVRVKKSHIEFQLDGGGFGSLSDALTQLNEDTTGSAARIAAERLTRGSRFNVRYKAALGPEQITEAAMRQALAAYVTFDPPEPQVAATPASSSGSDASRPPAPGATVDGTEPPPAPRPDPGSTPQLPVVVSWAPQTGWDRELFPSFIIATANMRVPAPTDDQHTIGDPSGLLGVRVVAPRAGARVRVTVTATGLMTSSSIDTMLPTAGTSYLVSPMLQWDYDALGRIRQTRPATITIALEVDGHMIGTTTERVTVHSVNDCPFAIVVADASGTPRIRQTWWMFAAYVNENHPYNDQIRKEALQSKIVSAFGGYQSNDPQEVVRQVYAIWYVLQRRGLKYSNITTTSGVGSAVRAQQVRFIDQSVDGAQANCVDGSVLLASLMREIGIDPVLVLVPGHMFVGFYTDPEHRQAMYLETTMLGSVSSAPSGDPLGMGRALFGDSSYDSFVGAWRTATERFQEDATNLTSGQPGYQLIDVGAARKMGILPIAFNQ